MIWVSVAGIMTLTDVIEEDHQQQLTGWIACILEQQQPTQH
jgi:hypothetical protein